MFKKSILIVINDITSSGGTERVAAFLANNFASSGYKVTLLTLLYSGSSPYYSLNKDVNLKVLDSGNTIKIASYLYSNKYDAIIPVSMGRLSFKVAIVHRALRLKSQLILSEHVGFETSSSMVRKLKLLSYNLASDLVLLTDHDYALLHSKTSAKVSVIRNATSFESIRPTELKDKEKVVLAVGRLTYQKAFEKLVDIWAELPNHHGWKLRIVGDGEDRDTLQQLIRHKGVEDTVELKPASKDIASEYRNASLFAMTSRYEGLPLVLIESKSFGLAAISFDCKTGPRELIRNNVDGYVIDEDDDETFKARLLSLINNDEQRETMQLAALSDSQNYSKDVVFENWLNLLSR
ncbi:glycosyltransferase family 4 protein [Pseudoalteromonas rubra]|uniref:Glycosyltransferase n=1 Tax=Pseudoalteromonas rubra TaxID=43658 RepID=A0A0F4QNM6_9GAMM|nr:glycosyltransferase family 4 protein [Pseudoalteromonas rubra]KJZ09303.1 glycosyltransferase [Pseudoalteromonas rubra]